MSAFLDTNVLIRHLTGDPPAQARRATAFLAAADELLVPDLIIAEVSSSSSLSTKSAESGSRSSPAR